MQEPAPLVIPRGPLVLLATLFEGGLILIAWLLGVGLGIPAFRGLGSSWAGAGLGVAASLPILLGVAGIRASGWPPFVRLREVLDRRVIPLFTRCTVADLGLISLLAGIGEEALFRGLLQAWMAEGIGPAAALVLAGILFGLAHPVSFGYAVYAGAVGVYLGALFAATGDLTVPALAHGAFDFLALLWLTRAGRSRSDAGADAAAP